MSALVPATAIPPEVSDEDLARLNDLANSPAGERHDEWMELLSRYPSLVKAIGPGRMDRFVEDELLIQLSQGDAGRYELWRAECRAMRHRYGCSDGDPQERGLVDNIILAFVVARLAVVRYASSQTGLSVEVDRTFRLHERSIRALETFRARRAREMQKRARGVVRMVKKQQKRPV